MTVEISILNKQGIALAADSAVTVSGFNKKVYNSVNKIFQLSDEIGIMVYGAADYLGVPWKIIISMFKKQCPDFSTLEECYQQFIDFIQSDIRFVNETAEESFIDYYATGMLFRYGNQLENENISLVDKKMGSKHKKLVLKYGQSVKEFHEFLLINDRTKKEERFVIKNMDLVINNIFNLFLVKTYLSESGIVIAGYGKDEIFPGYINIEIEGCFEGKMRHTEKAKEQVDTSSPGIIVTFAQDDVIKLFLHGISEEYIEMVPYLFEKKVEYALELFNENGLLKKLSAKERKGLLKIAEEVDKTITEETQKNLREYSEKSFVNNVRQMLGILPTRELVQLAESMINITTLKRRITDTHEGVGGETDVAIITKEEGFEWVRIKKLYGKDDC